MHLKFEIQNKKIKRKNIKVLATSESKCSFLFLNHEWVPIEKYAIFWDKKGKSFIRYLGTGKNCECSIPDEVFEHNVFSIQVWANDDMYTQKLKLGSIPDGYTISNQSKKKKKKKSYDEKDPEMILYHVFSQLDSKIDDIVYKNGFLECYSNNKLVCKTPVFRDITNEIQDNIKKLMPYFEVNEDGNLYVIYPYER